MRDTLGLCINFVGGTRRLITKVFDVFHLLAAGSVLLF